MCTARSWTQRFCGSFPAQHILWFWGYHLIMKIFSQKLKHLLLNLQLFQGHHRHHPLSTHLLFLLIPAIPLKSSGTSVLCYSDLQCFSNTPQYLYSNTNNTCLQSENVLHHKKQDKADHPSTEECFQPLQDTSR